MKRIPLLALAVLLAAACSSLTSTDVAFLPKLDPPRPGLDDVRLTGAFSGVLVVERGCVRLLGRTPSSLTTVLWHNETELHRDGSGYFLRNSLTGTRYQFGRPIAFGGGQAQQEWIERQYPEVAKRCGPPYASGWLAE